MVRYTILGLDPGELYTVELSTKTGSVPTRQPILENILTKPLPPSALSVSEVTSESCMVQWAAPEGKSQPCLKEFHLKVMTSDGKVFRDTIQCWGELCVVISPSGGGEVNCGIMSPPGPDGYLTQSYKICTSSSMKNLTQISSVLILNFQTSPA